MLYLLCGSVLFAATLGYLIFATLGGPTEAAIRAVANLQRGVVEKLHASGGPAKPKPVFSASVMRIVIPDIAKGQLARLLAQAGRPVAWPLARVLEAKMLLALVGVVVGILFAAQAGSKGPLFAVVGAGVAVIMYFVPELRLYSLGLERRQKILVELADTLDQMSIAVDAGLGFDAAMARVAQNGRGVLAQELIRTLQDIQVGKSHRDAYEDLIDRTHVADLKLFIRSVIQAEQYGLALSTVLNTQAAEMRMKRRQRAEKKAMQIPIKVIFPLMLFVMPVLFIMVLGPAAITIVAQFSK